RDVDAERGEHEVDVEELEYRRGPADDLDVEGGGDPHRPHPGQTRQGDDEPENEAERHDPDGHLDTDDRTLQELRQIVQRAAKVEEGGEAVEHGITLQGVGRRGSPRSQGWATERTRGGGGRVHRVGRPARRHWEANAASGGSATCGRFGGRTWPAEAVRPAHAGEAPREGRAGTLGRGPAAYSCGSKSGSRMFRAGRPVRTRSLMTVP